MADAGSERGLELQQALIERGGDLAAVRGQAGVEGVDIVLQAVGDILRPLAHALDDLAAEGLDGAVEFRDVAGDQGAERAAVAGEFLHQFAALVLHHDATRPAICVKPILTPSSRLDQEMLPLIILARLVEVGIQELARGYRRCA